MTQSERTQSLERFRSDQLKLIKAADEFCDLAMRRGDKTFIEQARELVRKLEAAHLNLVVLGEFKRGKSTFVNALLGEPLLPTAVVPLTSIVTVIGYAPERQVLVRFNVGRTETVPIGALASYITESENPGNEKGVKLVEIGYPAPILRDGVRIVDTPGTGSVYEHNTEATNDYLPEADALIFLLTADQPASRAELDLLHRARAFTTKYFIVQNKIDYLDHEQRKQSLEFLERTLSYELNEKVRIYPVSARAALDRRNNDDGKFDSLRSEILHFLLVEKGDVLIQNAAARLRRMLDQADEFLALESNMAAMSSAVIDEKIAAFRESASNVSSAQRDAEYFLHKETKDLVDRIGSDLKSYVAARREEMCEKLNSAFQANRSLNNFRLIKELSIFVENETTRIFTEWRLKEEDAIRQTFEGITERFAQYAKGIVADIENLTMELFGTRISVQFGVEPLTEKSHHYYFTKDPFPHDIFQLFLVLPGLKEYIRKKFSRSATLELLRNAERLRFDFQERIEISSHEFLNKFGQGAQQVADQVEDAIRQTAMQLAAAREAGEEVNLRNRADSEHLNMIRQEIDQILTA